MKSLSGQCVVWMVFAIGCASEPPLDNEEALATTTAALQITPQVINTWQLDGHENCNDLCGLQCNCIKDRCPASPNGGSPDGDACAVVGDTCNYLSGVDVWVYECRAPKILNVLVLGQGSVSGTSISCPGDCTGDYPAGSNVVLTATAASGSQFFRWSSGCGAVTANNPIVVNMSMNRNCAAIFLPVGF